MESEEEWLLREMGSSVKRGAEEAEKRGGRVGFEGEVEEAREEGGEAEEMVVARRSFLLSLMQKGFLEEGEEEEEEEEEVDPIVEGDSIPRALVDASSLELPELWRTSCFLPKIPLIPFPLPFDSLLGASSGLSSTVSTSLTPSVEPSS